MKTFFIHARKMKFSQLRLLLISTVLLIVYNGSSQNSGSYRVGRVVADSIIIRLDSVSIVPESFLLKNVGEDQFRLDPITAKLYILDSALLGVPLVFSYETYQLDFSKPLRHRDLSLIESPRHYATPKVNSLVTVADRQMDDQLITSGSISRGVSVGNAQDLVLNSSLNLQLVGKLSEDVEIAAVISDKNIPIQPEGNTQSIYDINNIFITIKLRDFLRVDAGDIDLLSPSDMFLKASRSVLGLKLDLHSDFKKNVRLKNSLGGGVAKGKFVRQSIAVQNGVQGPYKLYSQDGALGIVVVAASERVYVDGVLLKRGQENDYVIDYNTAELTFTPSMLMTSEKRVIVEFEYTDKHFSRINLFSYNELSMGKKWNLRVNFYQEQDLKSQSIQPELDDAQKLFLSTMGDDLAHCYYPYADSASNVSGRVLYCKKDTVVDGVLYHDVYEYCTVDSVRRYALGFTYMGTNKGSYRLLQSTANGRVFEWIPPEDGEMRGEYEPVILLSTPKLLQMATVSADYNYQKDCFVKMELAMSNHDQNTFSASDDGDNVGFAYFLDFCHNQPLLNKQNDTTTWRLLSSVRWQFIHKNFTAVESFREVEFARNFNLKEDYSSQCSEQFLEAEIGFRKQQQSITTYSVNWLSRLGNATALRNKVSSKNHFGKCDINTETSMLYTRDSLWRSRFWVSNNDFSYRIGSVVIGFVDKVEHNIFQGFHTDTLRADSYAFNDLSFFVRNSDTTLFQYAFSYKNRLDFDGRGSSMENVQQANELSALFAFDRLKNQHFAVNGTYRNQQILDTLEKSSSEHYFVGKLEYSGRFWKNAVVVSTYYEAGSGMEQKRQFTYIRVADGQGTHVWNDYNGNGIEEIDEFEVAAFQDQASYVKVWLSGTEYRNIYNSQFAQSIQLRPYAVWSNAKGFRRFMARFQDVAMFRSQMKNAQLNFNPFYAHLEDTSLVSRQLSFNNTLSFNNSASKFSADFTVQENQTKNLLYYGFESNTVSLQEIMLKSSPCKFLFLQTGYQHHRTENVSELMPSRCYQIEKHQGDLKVQTQFNNRYMTTIAYSYISKKNHQGGESVQEHKLMTTFDFRMLKRGVLSFSAQYIQIGGSIKQGTSLAYVMLEGLSCGRNAIWRVAYQMAVTEYLQLSLEYDGRASQGHRVVHTGNLTVKAQF